MKEKSFKCVNWKSNNLHPNNSTLVVFSVNFYIGKKGVISSSFPVLSNKISISA